MNKQQAEAMIPELITILDGAIKYAPMVQDKTNGVVSPPEELAAIKAEIAARATTLHAQAVGRLRTELQRARYAGKTVAEIRALLEAPEVVTQPVTRPKVLTVEWLLSGLTPESLVKLMAWPHLTDLRDMVVRQDREGAARWASLLAGTGFVSVPEAGAVLSKLTETEQTEVVDTLMPPIFRAYSGIPYARNSVGPDAVIEEALQ